MKSGVFECYNTNRHSSLPDDELVRLAQQRDEDAFAELLRRSQDICHRVAFSILRDRESAADEVQNAFWKAYRHLPRFSQQSRFSTWLVRIVMNHCIMHLRRENGRSVRLDKLTADGEVNPPNVGSPSSPEDELGQKQVREVVRREVARIPCTLRAPLELRDLDELPVKQVAVKLGLNEAAVKSRVLRGHEFLRGHMVRHFGTRGVGTLTRIAS
jgi:RNA polymerase sigma-70 factor (ECF subfamily)